MRVFTSFVATLMVAFLSGPVLAEEAKTGELEATKAKTEQMSAENEALASKIKELEERAFGKDESVDELDEKIQLIKAKLEKPAE